MGPVSGLLETMFATVSTSPLRQRVQNYARLADRVTAAEHRSRRVESKVLISILSLRRS